MTERPEERDSLEDNIGRRVREAPQLRTRIAALEAEVKELREANARFASERVPRDIATREAVGDKLAARIGGLLTALNEMEPGEREFCLAALDEILDALNAAFTRSEQMKEALREGRGHIDSALSGTKSNDWGYVRSEIHAARAALSPSDTEEEA